MIKIVLLGSTGSIGRQVLNVVDRHPDKFKIISLSAGSNAELLGEQINKYKPQIATLNSPENAVKIKSLPSGTSMYYGENSMLHAITEDCDVVFVAVMGFAGLNAVITAINMKKNVALANKETLVAGGEIVTKLAREKGVKIIPVDSEHSALFQCLSFDKEKPFRKLILTASGGAFRGYTVEQLKNVTAKDALKHPTWQMGKKITIDCATMFNKGLEVIEAMWLYDAPLNKIDVIIHPQSIVHSMVEFEDSSVMAQMAYPSMEIPITLALTYPERIDAGVKSLDLRNQKLEFYEMTGYHKCFDLVIESAKLGKNIPCAVSGANEKAVELFLQDKIKYLEIADYIEDALSKTEIKNATLDNLQETDRLARYYVEQRFLSKGQK